jgi:hypothetical protein
MPASLWREPDHYVIGNSRAFAERTLQHRRDMIPPTDVSLSQNETGLAWVVLHHLVLQNPHLVKMEFDFMLIVQAS